MIPSLNCWIQYNPVGIFNWIFYIQDYTNAFEVESEKYMVTATILKLVFSSILRILQK